MQYYSLNNSNNTSSFRDAVIRGLAPDKGLYFPKQIMPLSSDFIRDINSYSKEAIALEVIQQFVGDEIPTTVLEQIIAETLAFDFPLVDIESGIKTMELFHGPTMAFKDVGARFMARCLAYFNRENPKKITVLVATSGDTGGAVASGFLNVEHVDVVILYPSKKVSAVQEQQLTTLGHNIRALEVDGTFDDCQAMVKRAFLDASITDYRQLSSANSINIARWLPQMFYFFFAYQQLSNKEQELYFSVPSGNFGNICAGMMAQQLGLPIQRFIAANNANDTVLQYLKTQAYTPKPSIQTISNAMDVGDPSNFVRIQELYGQSFERLQENLVSYTFTDDQTRAAMKQLYENAQYIADPHGAIGYLGLKAYGLPKDSCGIFLETAHPVKFLDVVEPVIGQSIPYPPQIEAVMNKHKCATQIASYEELKDFLLA